MRLSFSSIRPIAAAVLAVIGAISLQRAPQYAWGGVTLDGQRYKFSAEHVYAIVAPDAPPPAFTGCRWAEPREESQLCQPVRGAESALRALELTPTLISLAALLALVSGGLALLGRYSALARGLAAPLFAMATATALAAMLLPFLTMTRAVGALSAGSVFFGARGVDYMLVAIVAAGVPWALTRRPIESGYMARSTAATVAAV